MEEIKFLRSEINSKNEIIKSLFTSKSMLHNEHFFFLITQNKLNILMKTIKKLVIQRKVDKIIKKKRFFPTIKSCFGFANPKYSVNISSKAKRHKNM